MRRVRVPLLAVVVVTMIFGLAGPAAAVDPPKWVAALYVQAQEMVGLRWTPVAGATGYKVLRSTTGGSGHVEIAAPTQPQHFDKDIEPGTDYFYILQAVAGAEVSGPTVEKLVKIPGQKKADEVLAPEWDKIVAQQVTEFGKTSFKVGLFWKAVKGNVAAYNLYRSETPGKDYALVGSVVETQYVDAAVEPTKTYYYVLTALDAATFMETPYSPEKSVELKLDEKKKATRKKREKIIQNFRVSSIVWSVKSGEWGNLSGPSDLDINFDDGEIYVSNFEDKSIYAFDMDGEYLRRFGAKSPTNPDGLTDPKGIFFDPDDGLIYVGNPRDSRVVILKASDGTVVHTFPILSEHGVMYPGEDYKKVATIPPAPTDVGVTADGDTLVVVDNGRSKVLLYDKKGTFIKEISKGVGRGEPGTFSFPTRVKFNKNAGFEDDILVVDGFGTRVQVYSFATEEWRAFGELGEVAGAFKTPLDVDVSDDNHIFTADKDNFNVTEFDYDGKYLTLLGQKEENAEYKNHLLLMGTPVGIRLDNANNVAYIADYYGSQIHKIQMTDEIFTPEGQ